MSITIDGKREIFPQVQKIKPDWRNLHSVWNYSEKDFEYLISTIKVKPKSSLFYAITSSSIALNEAYILEKKPEFNTPLVEAQYDKSLIKTLYEDLKQVKRAKAKETLELPYDMRSKAQEGRYKETPRAAGDKGFKHKIFFS